MSRSDTHGNRHEKLDARLENAFRSACEDRDVVRIIKSRADCYKKLAGEWPSGTAAEKVEGWLGAVSRLMNAERARAIELYKVDIAAHPGRLVWPKPRRFAEESAVLRMANGYLILQDLCRKLAEYMADKSLSEAGLISKAGDAYVEAMQTREAALLHGLQEMSVRANAVASQKDAAFVGEMLRLRLSGHLVTRISLKTNRRLAKTLDDIREHNKPASRERFEVLLRELYALAPAVWDEHHVTDKRLLATRNAVVEEITGRETERKGGFSEEQALDDFVTREALLKRGREVGLPPREYEVFRFFVEHPGAKNAAVARALGIAEGTVKSYKSRIKKNINTA